MSKRKTYICTHSETKFYTKHKLYEAELKGTDGVFKADDGLDDSARHLQSRFKPYTSQLYLIENKEKI